MIERLAVRIRRALLYRRIATLRRDIRHLQREVDRMLWAQDRAEQALLKLTPNHERHRQD